MPRKISLTLPGAMLLLIITGIFSACKGHDGGQLPHGDTLTTHSALLTIIDHSDGIVSARVTDPWNENKILATYLLIDRSIPDDKIPDIEGAIQIRVPVQSAIVYSGVHSGPIEEMGAQSVIKAVADSKYFTSPFISKGLADGTIADVGNSMAPILDRIIELDPEIAIVSPYENAGHGALEKTGIAVIDMADYMEPTPMGRAEWILLLGALTGNLDRAQQIFDHVEQQYDSIRADATTIANRPLVLSELPYSGVWYQPGGHSYAAAMIRDAGGRPLLDDDTSTGSVQLDIANVYDKGIDADIWLVKSLGPMQRSGFTSATPVTRDIKALRTGNIFSVNTLSTTFYDDIAFHPERILSDMRAIFAGDTAAMANMRYYQRVR